MTELHIKPSAQDAALPTREDYRHFAPTSQTYTSADILQQYLNDGWLPVSRVVVEVYPLGPGRAVSVYHFLLRNAQAEVSLPIIASPLVWRVISEHKLTSVYHHIRAD